MTQGLRRFLRSSQQTVDRALGRFLSPARTSPATLTRAIRYMVLPGGKRIRPAVVFAVCQAHGGTVRQAVPAACAVELIHCYSLVHDDLPCMDDDDMRRGRPSCHKKYDEATAVLVGDALQSLGFEVVAHSQPLVAELARWSGPRGLVGGQVLDLQEGRGTVTKVREIHLRKTAALFECSSRMGAISAGVRSKPKIDRAGDYGRNLGLLFQVVDDLLDRGEEPDKLTYPGVAGVKGAQSEARRLADRAVKAAGGNSRLKQIVEFLVNRRS